MPVLLEGNRLAARIVVVAQQGALRQGVHFRFNHIARGFAVWLAGGGVKRGHVHGRTNDTGAQAVEGKLQVRDWYATGTPPFATSSSWKMTS